MLGPLPPEVISGQIYAGPGATPLTMAAQAWIAIAEDWEALALQLQSTTASLGAAWQGPSAMAMAASARQFSTWMEDTAATARGTAQSAMTAVGVYEQVLAAVVPPPVIASNRTLLLLLIATNLLGQNSAAIAANEAQYAQMWAQDLAAMAQYQAASQATTAALQPFQPAPAVTSGAAGPAVAAPTSGGILGILENLLGVTPAQFFYDTFQSLLSSGYPVDIVALFTSFFGPFLGSSVIASDIAAQNAIIASKPSAPMAIYPPPSEPKVPEVKAASGTANRMGPLRVPPSWTQPKSPVATPMPSPGGGKEEKIPVGLPVIPAVPVTGGRKKKRSGYSDPDDMHYGRPSPPVLRPHPSGG